jgi:hypothetical protein
MHAHPFCRLLFAWVPVIACHMFTAVPSSLALLAACLAPNPFCCKLHCSLLALKVSRWIVQSVVVRGPGLCNPSYYYYYGLQPPCLCILLACLSWDAAISALWCPVLAVSWHPHAFACAGYICCTHGPHTFRLLLWPRQAIVF